MSDTVIVNPDRWETTHDPATGVPTGTVLISGGESPIASPEQFAKAERAVYVLPGGGKRIKFTTDGHEVTIGGESLAHALRGRRIQKPCIPGDVIFNGAEIVVYYPDAAAEWLRRGGKDLGPLAVVVGEEPVPTKLGKSVPEQQNQAMRDEHARDVDTKNQFSKGDGFTRPR